MNIPMSVMAEHWKGTVTAAICPGNYPSSLQLTKKRKGIVTAGLGLSQTTKAKSMI